MKIKSLVTGGAGFIGAHVTNELIKMGHYVIVLDDLSGGFQDHVHPKAKFIKGSVVDDQLIKSIFNENKIDYIYHLAAYAAEGLSHFIKNFNYMNNLIGSVNLINAAINHKIKCFVFTSSIAVYGAGQLPMTEDMIPLPEDPYGNAKLAVERELKISEEFFGLPYVIFRPHNVYGKYQNIGDKYRNVVGIFMNQLMQGKSLTVFGDGNQTRAFSYIGDVAPYIAKSIDVKDALNQTFNIGADKEYTIIELAKTVMSVMKMKGDLNHLPSRNEVLHAYSDHSKAKNIFNIQQTTTLQEGLEKMAEWAIKTGSRQSEEFDNIEIFEKLPPSWKPVQK